MKVLLIFLAAVIGGLSDNHVIITNQTGLPIARLEIDGLRLEANPGGGSSTHSILITVTPEKHDIKILFRGGAHVRWPHFDFRGVHEIIFELNAQHEIDARVQ